MSRLYIGRLSYNAREKDVDRFFRGFGRIKDINLKNGFGFVEFDDPRDADDAVHELNGRELLGERVIVDHSRGTSSGYGRRYGSGGGDRDRDRGDRYGGGGGGGRDRGRRYGPPTRTDYRILIENISSRVSWQGLKDYMRSAGEITFADAHKQRVGEGVVEYATYDDMKNAMKKLDGTDLNGRRIKLSEDYHGSKKRSRSRSNSRGRSRSHSHSKYRSRSRSRSKSRDNERNVKSRSRSRSKSRSSHSRSRSRSRSRDNDRDNKSRSRSRSRERSRSKSKDVENNGEENPAIDADQDKQDV